VQTDRVGEERETVGYKFESKKKRECQGDYGVYINMNTGGEVGVGLSFMRSLTDSF